MNSYLINIYLDNDDRVEARSVGETPWEAQQRIFQAKELTDFIKGRTIRMVQVELEKPGVVDKLEPERYKFEESQEKAGWYVLTDTVDLMVLTFERGKLNETGKITALEGEDPKPIDMARYVRKFGDYLRAYHPEVLE